MRPLPILAAEASLGASLWVLKLAFVENNDIIEWVELGQAFLSQLKEKWGLYDFCTYGPFPGPSMAPLCLTGPLFLLLFPLRLWVCRKLAASTFSPLASVSLERGPDGPRAIMAALYQGVVSFSTTPPNHNHHHHHLLGERRTNHGKGFL